MFFPLEWSDTLRFGIGAVCLWTVCALASEPEPPLLTLDNAVRLAIDNDPWLDNSRHSENALIAESISASALPDPKMTVAVANLPTDTFDFQQEAMTQFTVGVSQMFPRGDSLKLKEKQLSLLGDQHPYLRQDREAKVKLSVSLLWLECFKARQSIALIEKNRALFQQLVDLTHVGYSTATGQTRQQDIVRAQLELTRLEDRLTALAQQQAIFEQQLSEWLTADTVSNSFSLPATLPQSKLPPEVPTEQQIQQIRQHPAILAVEKKIQATGTNIDLAKQKYKPEWGINASYGYRDDAPDQNGITGMERADFFSVGVTFDLPLFTSNRQDKDLDAAISKTEAIKTEKQLMLRQMVAGLNAAQAQLNKINQRQQLYQSRLLPQMHEQAELSLSAYTNDRGSFAEVVQARIAELNAEIDALAIDVEKQKLIAQINYFLPGNEIIEEEQP